MSFQLGIGFLGGTVFFAGVTLYLSGNYDLSILEEKLM